MTEQIKILESFKETFSGTDNINTIDTAIRSLQAWEEVLQELEEEQRYLGNTLFQRQTYEKAIDIINQKLKEVKNES